MCQLNVSVLTLFPDMFPGPLGQSLAGKALAQKEWDLHVIDLRSFSSVKHQKVDDTPFGGGHGLVMRPDVIDAALTETISHHKNPRIIYFSPRGIPLTQARLNHMFFATPPESEPIELILLCGRYEGVDQRVIDYWNMEEISIGDYILSGGELAALVFLDALVRKIILQNQETLKTESFEVELLEYPQYTVPREFHNLCVPDVLLSGHHKAIEKWRYEQSVQITRKRRPDLWARYLRKQ